MSFSAFYFVFGVSTYQYFDQIVMNIVKIIVNLKA